MVKDNRKKKRKRKRNRNRKEKTMKKDANTILIAHATFFAVGAA